MAAGESVSMCGFSTFSPKRRAAIIGRAIKKEEAVHIPSHYVPAINSGSEFNEAVAKLPATERLQR